ncbi:unnamed protein product [Closterium sp. Yama58-4]|nr:unnamed protein product [Closterium sp. Yama58-4]
MASGALSQSSRNAPLASELAEPGPRAPGRCAPPRANQDRTCERCTLRVAEWRRAHCASTRLPVPPPLPPCPLCSAFRPAPRRPSLTRCEHQQASRVCVGRHVLVVLRKSQGMEAVQTGVLALARLCAPSHSRRDRPSPPSPCAQGPAGRYREARLGSSWRGSTWQLRSGRAAAGGGDGRGRMGGVGQARASVDELAGVLVLSAVPFVAVKALANSGVGGQLSQRLQHRLPDLRQAAEKVEAQREEAREQSPWYGAYRPRWLDPLAVPGAYPPHLDGRVAGDFAFDPAGLARDPAAFQRYCNLEILHARWAMLGALGAVVPEVLQRYSNTTFLEPVWWRVGAAKLAGDDLDYLGVPGLHVAGGQGVVVIAIAQFLLMLGPEYARYTGIAALEPLGVFLPGDINHPGGWLFDPLGLANHAQRFEDMKVREIKNGRVAMVAWVGFAAQAVVRGQGVLDDWDAFLSDPLHNNAIAFALH